MYRCATRRACIGWGKKISACERCTFFRERLSRRAQEKGRDRIDEAFKAITGGQAKSLGIRLGKQRMLVAHSWPENIRGLRYVIERAVMMCEGEEIGLADLPVEFAAAPDIETPAKPKKT